MGSGASRYTVGLVRRAVEEGGGFWKEAGRQLALYDPCVETAGELVASYRSGESPGYLVAYLLGQVGHVSGYETAREILEAGEQQLSEDYAARAMARIDPERATGDLMAILKRTDSGAVRRAAAAGLGTVGDAAAKRALVAAVGDGLLFEESVARELETIGVAEDELVAWLRAEPPLARVAVQILANRARRDPRPLAPSRAIRELVLDVAERVCVLDGPKRRVRDWLAGEPSSLDGAVARSLTGDPDAADLSALEYLTGEVMLGRVPGWGAWGDETLDAIFPVSCTASRGELELGGTCILITSQQETAFYAHLKASDDLSQLTAVRLKVGEVDLETGAMRSGVVQRHLYNAEKLEQIIWCYEAELTQLEAKVQSRTARTCPECGEIFFAESTGDEWCPECAEIDCAHTFIGGRCSECFALEPRSWF